MKKLTIITLLTMAFFLGNHLHADTWRVNNNPLYTNGCDHCFSELQEAVNSTMVSPGDTIHIEASTSDYEGVDIDKQLVIIGPGYFLNENNGLQQNQLNATVNGDINLNAGCEGSVLTGLRVKGAYASINIYTDDINIKRCYSGSAGLYFNNNEWTISNIYIAQCFLSKITHIGYPDPITNLNISNCYIDGGVYLPGSGSDIYEGVFTQNVVAGNFESSNGIDVYNNIFKSEYEQGNNSTSNVFNNIFTSELPVWLDGSSNIHLPEGTVFIAEGSPDGILHLNPSNICPECYQGYSPSGTNDEELGIYGGSAPYVLSGIPSIPTVYELHNSTHVYQSDTTHVTIGTRSNY